MARLSRRLVVIAVTVAFVAALGLVAPPGESGGVGPETAAAAALPQPGKRGKAVRALQKRLVDASYLRVQYRTGYYGGRTEKAVKALQKAYHLKATGRMTKATDRVLTKAVAAMTKPRTWYHAEVIGRSQSGRKITTYRAGEAGKPVVVVMATMHGEEDFGQYVAYGLMEGRPIKDIDLWVLPVVNPDGLAKDRRWVNGHVDLNRNFSYSWVKRANSGPRAVSERETKVIMDFLTRTKPRYLVSWHQPLRGVDTDKVKDLALSKRLAKNLQLPLKELDCGGVCHGTMTAWYNHTFAGTAVTVEYGSAARTTRRMKTQDADAVLTSVGGRRG
jgi:peptidoglycan hydrolase-like protein with peptidoglycan-binding domain